MGREEGGRFELSPANKDNESQQSQQFKKFALLILDLFHSTENEDHEVVMKGQRVTLTTYMNAVNKHVTDIQKRQKELHTKLIALEKTLSEPDTANASSRTKSQANDDSNHLTLGKRFLQVMVCDSPGLHQFIFYNPEILEEEHIKYLHGEGMEAIEKGADSYTRACLHHWQLLSDCLPLGAHCFSRAIMGPPCEASKDFHKRVEE